MPLIFQAKLPPDITYWHREHFWRNQLRENALSSAPLTRRLTLTKGSLGAEGVVECRYPRCWAVPSAHKPPPGISLICVGSIRRALARSPSLLLRCQQLEELLVSDRQLCHTRMSFFGSKFICSVSTLCCSRGRGKWQTAPLEFHSYFLCLCLFVYLGRSFLDWLFCRNIRPVWERLLLCSPGSIKHSFFFSPSIWSLFSQA